MAAAGISREHITGLVLAGGEGRRMGGVDKGLVDWRGRPLAAHAIERLRPQVGALLVSANRNAARYAALGAPVLGDIARGDERDRRDERDQREERDHRDHRDKDDDAHGARGADHAPRRAAAPQGPAAAAAPAAPAGSVGPAATPHDRSSAPGAPAAFVGLGPLAGILTGLRHAATPWLAVVPCDAPRFPADLVARLVAGRGDAPIVYARAGRTHPVFCIVATALADALDRSLAAGERRVEGWMRAHGGVAVDFPDESAFANFNTPENLEDAA